MKKYVYFIVITDSKYLIKSLELGNKHYTTDFLTNVEIFSISLNNMCSLGTYKDCVISNMEIRNFN
jgi:hypothetical protein